MLYFVARRETCGSAPAPLDLLQFINHFAGRKGKQFTNRFAGGALFFPCNLQVQALAEADLQDACEIRLNRRRELAHVLPSSRRQS